MNNCLNCGTTTNNAKFCSRSCAAIINNKIPKRKLTRKCTHCDNLIKDYRSTLCQFHFNENIEKKKLFMENLTLADYFNKESIKRLHKSSKFAHIRLNARAKHKNLTKLPCANCGYNKHVELCHIKALSSFSEDTIISIVNSKDNIIQLCPNCHWEFDRGLLKLSPR